jgi:hypothetical protein
MIQNYYILLILITLSPFSTKAQSQYYFGLDLGPKMELYRLGESSVSYESLKIRPDIGAAAGIAGGVIQDDKFGIEVGLYRNNFRTKIEIFDEQGQSYFTNDLIATFSSVRVPVSFLFKHNTRLEQWQIFSGIGFTSFIGSKLDQQGFSTSPAQLVNPEDPSEGYLQYNLSENRLTGGLMAATIQFRTLYLINQQLHFFTGIYGRFGTSGSNIIDISHYNSITNQTVKNSIYTRGNAWGVSMGFRFYLEEDEL